MNPFWLVTNFSIAWYNIHMKTIDLSKKLLPYENKWVALSEDNKQVLGAGDTLEQAEKQAKKTGKRFLFLRVPPFDISYVPANR